VFAEYVLQVPLLLATLLCTLVAGFVLLFAIVVMPGIGTLPNDEFLRSFQVIDKVIQNNQPLFVFIWIGSIAALVAATALSVWQLEGLGPTLMLIAVTSYLAGTQLPTFTINIPLNNRVQSLELETLDETSLANERQYFESRWNRWNVIRTASACLTSVLLLVVERLN